jgi:hypothetical protein
MKICWDNLEKLRYSKRTGNWWKGNSIYIYVNSCKTCNEPYITQKKKKIGEFCCKSCVHKNKIVSDEAREKISKVQTGRKRKPLTDDVKRKIRDSNIGKKRSDKTRKRISDSKIGKFKGRDNHFYSKKHSNETKEKMRIKKIGINGCSHPQWKGGVTEKNIPLYDTYAHQIEYAEQVRRNSEDNNILEVKCTYCGKWYIPKSRDIWNRINALNGKVNGEYRLYCSDNCKQECPIFNQKKYPKGFKQASSREVQPELRQMVFERDNWTCQNPKCKSKKNLHCHHKEGIRWEPLESADIDQCITYCKHCHQEAHEKEGCRTVDMQCK